MRIKLKYTDRGILYLDENQAGNGSFLEHPNHPTHFWGAVEVMKNGRGDYGCSSIESYRGLFKEVDDIYAKTKIRTATDPVSIDWIRQVLGYFKNCYSPDGKEWSANKLVIKKDGEVNLHAGIHHIRKTYPGYVATKEDWENAYWGKK